MWPLRNFKTSRRGFIQETAENYLYSCIVDCGTLLCASEKGVLGEKSEPAGLAMERVVEAPGKKCAVPSSTQPLGSLWDPVKACPVRTCVSYRLQATY